MLIDDFHALSLEDRQALLERMDVADRLRGLDTEERLRGLDPEERLRGLDPRSVYAGWTPNRSKRGLSVRGIDRSRVHALRSGRPSCRREAGILG